MSTQTRAQNARIALTRISHAPPPTPDPLPPDLRAWEQIHRPLICDFLLRHLDDHQLVNYSVYFTILHEFVGAVVASVGSRLERDARHGWLSVNGHHVVQLAALQSLLDADVALEHRLPWWLTFLYYLATRDLVTPECASRIAHELPEALASYRRAADGKPLN